MKQIVITPVITKNIGILKNTILEMKTIGSTNFFQERKIYNKISIMKNMIIAVEI